MTPKINMIVDSGAFSAFRLKKTINLDKYCDFILENQDWIGSYVSLDVINPGDPEAAAAAGFENFLYMRKQGLEPIPVFHAREDIKWLLKYLDAKCKYIGISASTLAHTSAAADDWYSMVWPYMVDSSGLPIVKTHAFGEGRLENLKRFPWYSADSASWIYTAQVSGEIQMAGTHARLSFRGDGDSPKSRADVHSLPEHDKRAFEAVLARAGMTIEAFKSREGAEAYVARTFLTCLYYMWVQEQTTAVCPIQFRGSSFLGRTPSNLKAINIPDLRLHLVLGGNTSAQVVLAMAGHTNALVSYYHIGMNSSYRELRAYVTDPVAASRTTERCIRYFNILKEYVNAK